MPTHTPHHWESCKLQSDVFISVGWECFAFCAGFSARLQVISNITFKQCRTLAVLLLLSEQYKDHCWTRALNVGYQKSHWDDNAKCSVRENKLMSTAEPLFRVFYILQGVRPVQSHLNFCFCCPWRLCCLLGIILHWQVFFLLFFFWAPWQKSLFLVPEMLS